MSLPTSSLERIRCLQAMIFGTAAGEILRERLMAAGHFYEEVENDQARIEQNLVKRLMVVCGVVLECKAKVLPVAHQDTGNAIDDILQSKEGVTNHD